MMFKDLGIQLPNETTIINFNNNDISVRKYLPINEKLNLITDIINDSADSTKYFNAGKLEVFTSLYLVSYYTDLNIDDEIADSPTDVYDLLYTSGLMDTILATIGTEELSLINNVLRDTIQSVYSYNNSAMGIIDTISQDHSNLQLDINKLQEALEGENFATVAEVMKKLG